MIILHGGFLDSRLFLWGEAPEDPDALGKIGARSRARSAPPPPYPFDAGFDVVARAVRTLPIEFKPTKRRASEAAVWLPTQGSHPHASSELISPAPTSRAKLKLAPWTVSGLSLDDRETFQVLTAWTQRGFHGIAPGRDLNFWLHALRVAGSMVARQRYLPGIQPNGSVHARWEPVWLGEDASGREDLARRMPAAARALTSEPNGKPPDTPAVDVVEDFLGAQVDQIVRAHFEEANRELEPPETNGAKARGTPAGDRNGAKPGTVYDRWLKALRTPDACIKGDKKELEARIKELERWRGPIDEAANAPFRLCFRLEEPTTAAEETRATRGRRGRSRGGARKGAVRPGQRRWYVRYLLQATDDPTLLVPTADAWITRGRKAAALAKMGTDLHEALLGSLGQAAGVCPKIEESLRSRKPSGYSLDARGAHEFLTATAPALEQAGFGTLLPDWWKGGTTEDRLAVRARVRTPELPEGSEPDLDDVVDFDWEICIAGKPLSGRDLEELARLKEPLQYTRGHWVELGVEEIHAALEFWKQRKGGSISARELVKLALGSADESAGIHFEGVRATGWIDDLLSQLTDKTRIKDIEPPKGFVGELRRYQEHGYAWLEFLQRWGLGACLADDMGLGKTIQTLALLQRERELGEDRPVLLVCPTSVLSNWEHEAARFTPRLSTYVHHGAGRPKGWEFTQEAQDRGVVLTSYALLHRDLEDLSMVQWAGLVLDEAQNVKNPDTKQSQAVRALHADYKLALTGTPVENHVGDLWSIMDFLNPGFLGSEAEFKRNFFVPIQAHRDREASERLQKMTSPFILRRLKTDRSIISDLPEKNEMKVFCNLTAEQGKLYQEVVAEAERKIKDSEGIERRGVILATLSKLKQVCNHPAHFLGDDSELGKRSGKLIRLSEMLEELDESGDRSLIFTQFAKMGTLLQGHLEEVLGREVLYLHGGTPKKRRDAMVQRFQSGDSDAPPIFILSLKAGGTGLNLTGANHVFHFDRWWNPAVENQATDRAFRIGQKRRVQVHKFVCAGTLEESIDMMIERKRSIAEDIVGSGENWITELSDDELHEMFALHKNAVRD
jgi:SNF2 family DNA or RNA helicase